MFFNQVNQDILCKSSDNIFTELAPDSVYKWYNTNFVLLQLHANFLGRPFPQRMVPPPPLLDVSIVFTNVDEFPMFSLIIL